MKNSTILGLDFGEERVGVAISIAVGLARPLVTLANSENLVAEIKRLLAEHVVAELVIGLPRNLSGDETSQTAAARKFANGLKTELEIPVYLIDEAATSVEAEARLKASNKPYDKGDIDALAAALILEDYLANERYAEQL